jgi:serine/threonine-protein kinase
LTLEQGARLGRHEILELRGRGGMGEVYRARDTQLDRDVAIKVLRGELSRDPAFQRRFEREARTISALQHANVCALHDVGSENGVDYLVMEYLEGESLADRIRRGPLPIAEGVRIGRDIAEALEAAHRRGIVHRDLKPGNVMLTAAGTKVVDFGLALGGAVPGALDGAAASMASTMTAEGRLAGTLPYLPPEQLAGKPADRRSDIWALGCVLYEMATGERPFRGDSQASLITAILSTDPAPPSHRQERTPEWLDRVVGRCLEKDPERRWQSARDVAMELEAAAAARPRPPETTRRTGATAASRSRATLEAIAAGVVAIAVVLALGFAWIGREPRAPETAASATGQPGSAASGAGQPASVAGTMAAIVPSVAVLPFEDMSAGGDHAYLSDGMAEEILNALARVDGLRVIARTSAFAIARQGLTIAEIGERLGGIEAVLEGSVRRADDQLRITARLTEVATGFELWSSRYDRPFADIFAIQDEIAREVVREVGPHLLAGREVTLATRPTENQEAYDLYLRAWSSWNQQTTAGFQQALTLVERSIALDPDFAEAHAFEGLIHLFLVFQGAHSVEGWAAAEAALRRALDLDPDLADAHATLGEIRAFNWDWEAAETHGRQAIALAPGYVLPLVEIGWVLAFTGRAKEAVEHLERARALDPLGHLLNRNLGLYLLWDRQYDRAIEQLRHSLALSGELPGTRLSLADAYWLAGDHEAWAAELEQIHRVLGAQAEAERIGQLFATSGPRAVLEWWVEYLTSSEEDIAGLGGRISLDRSRNLVVSYIRLGDLDSAFALLEPMVDRRITFSNSLKVNPLFDDLRGDPRHHALLRRMNLED